MPPALFERHSKKCTAKKCAKCEWSKRGPKRRKQCLLPDGKTTWITAAFTGRGVQKGNLKLGCVVCQKFLQKQVAGGSIPTTKETSVRHKFALFNMPVANIPRHNSNNLHRHGHTSTHVQAMLDWEESESSSGCAMASRAPGKQEFQD